MALLGTRNIVEMATSKKIGGVGGRRVAIGDAGSDATTRVWQVCS